MKSRPGIAAIAIAVVLLGACTATQPDQTDAASSSESPAPERDAWTGFTDLLTLAHELETGTPGEWHVNGARTAVVYELRTGAGYEVWALDEGGSRKLLAEAGTIEHIDLAADDRVAVTEKNETTGAHRILFADLDGSQVSEVTNYPQQAAVVGFSGDELIHASIAPGAIEFSAWNIGSGENRPIGSIAQEDPDVWSARVAGDHIVSTGIWVDRERLLAMRIADGSLMEVPHHDPNQRPRLVGVAPNGDGVFTEPRKGGGYIYSVDLSNPDQLTDFTDSAVVELVFMEGTSVRYGNTSGKNLLIDLLTGAETAAPPRSSEPTGPVPGLEDGHVRLIAELDNGNWLVTGWLVDGAEYRALWEFNDQFGGATSDEQVRVKGLFEYNPETEELWQLSGPPTFSATTTASGSGIGPNGVLRVEVLEGFVVFTTGFSGAAYDIAYNLYASPIPSLIGD